MKNQMYCKNCGFVGVPKMFVRGSFFIELVLWVCFIIPGIIYSIWRLTNKADLVPEM